MGTSSLKWRDLYIDGTAYLDAFQSSGADINGGSIDGVTIGTNSVVTDLRVDNVQVNGNTVTTTSGNLTLDSQGGTVVVNDTLQAQVLNIDNVRIDGNKIDTTSGKLELDAATNEVEINADIDHNGALNTSGNLVCGGSGTFSGDVIAFSSSDLTMKENVSPIDNALDMISSLTGNTFDWKSDAGIWGLEGGDTGIIAQEVEKLKLPGVTKKRGDGTIGVRYDRLIPVLIEAIKELKTEINELKN